MSKGSAMIATSTALSRSISARLAVIVSSMAGGQPSFTLPILPPSSDATPRPTPFAK